MNQKQEQTLRKLKLYLTQQEFTQLTLPIKPMQLKFTLTLGREVILDAFNLSNTYGRWIEGQITNKENLSI